MQTNSLLFMEKASNYRLLHLLILSLILMVLDQMTNWLDGVKSILVPVVNPIVVVADLPHKGASSLSATMKSRELLYERIEELENDLLLLQVKTEKMTALVAENNRLRTLLGSAAKLQDNVLVAEVIGIDPNLHEQEIWIDKGSAQKVFVGQPVLDDAGLMGQVTEVSKLTSRVLLLTSQKHSIPVEVLRSNLRLIAQGGGISQKLDLLYISPTADIRVGDQLLSSGLGNRFPAGYPVGVVTSVEREHGRPFAEAVAMPSAQLNRSRHVLLVFVEGQN